MSGSNEQRENIQRLAKGVKIKGPLGPVGTREPIRGKVTPFNENTFAPPSTAPAGYTEPACNPADDGDEDNDNNEPLDPIDPEDPNTFVRGRPDPDGSPKTDQGVANVGDAIDGTAGPQMPTTGGGTSGTGGLRELTGLKDCDTGKEFNLHLDGNFVPPEGWSDPDTGPEITGDWRPNAHWNVTNLSVGADIDGFTPQSVLTAWNAYMSSGADGTVSSYTFREGPFQTGESTYLFRWSAFIDGSGTGIVTTLINLIQCSSESSNQEFCSATRPLEESWPEDGSYDVAIKDGQFQTNENDADQPENFEPSGTKDFCYGDGSTGRAHVTADGGVMYYGTNEAGAPIGTARVMDSSGQLVAAGDATESFISQYLPQ